MTLKHLAAFLMLLCALGCQPSDSGSGASDEGGGTATETPEADTTAAAEEPAADEPAVEEEEQLAQVSFKVDGMR